LELLSNDYSLSRIIPGYVDDEDSGMFGTSVYENKFSYYQKPKHKIGCTQFDI
jgi:hypothetical protein